MSQWINRFKQGGESLVDQRRSERPKTAVTRANIRRVAELIEENPYVTYDEIEAASTFHKRNLAQRTQSEKNCFTLGSPSID